MSYNKLRATSCLRRSSIAPPAHTSIEHSPLHFFLLRSIYVRYRCYCLPSPMYSDNRTTVPKNCLLFFLGCPSFLKQLSTLMDLSKGFWGNGLSTATARAGLLLFALLVTTFLIKFYRARRRFWSLRAQGLVRVTPPVNHRSQVLLP